MAMVSTTTAHTSKRMGRWERRGGDEKGETDRKKSTVASDERR